MIELEISNFQSVRHTTLKVDGFATLVGKSNIGKSAIVRAVRCALTGATGTDFVRHSPSCDRIVRKTKKCKCFSRVRIKLPDLDVIWEKGDSVNRYQVSRAGSPVEVLEGLDKGSPDFFAKGFPQVKVGDRKELIQVPSQFEPIFLLNQTGSVVADVLSDVAKLDDLNLAMSLANKDRKNVEAKRKVRLEDVDDLEKNLALYGGLDDVPVQDLVRVSDVLTRLQITLGQIDRFQTRLDTLETSVGVLEEALRPVLPEEAPMEEKSRLFFKASALFESLVEKVTLLRGLKDIEGISLPDEAPLQDSQSLLIRVAAFHQSLETLEDSLETLGPVAEVTVPDIEGLQGTVLSLASVGVYLKRLEALEGFLETTPEYTSAEKTLESLSLDPLNGGVTQLEHTMSWLSRAQAVAEEVRRLTKELSEATKSVDALTKELNDLGVCPTCSQPLNGHALHLEAS